MGLLLDTREGEISRIEKNGKKGIQVLEEGQRRKWRWRHGSVSEMEWMWRSLV